MSFRKKRPPFAYKADGSQCLSFYCAGDKKAVDKISRIKQNFRILNFKQDKFVICLKKNGQKRSKILCRKNSICPWSFT